MWEEADPALTSVIQRSLSIYRHELLVENFSGIPVMQQHGSADDNVPAYHSRRLHQLISQTGDHSTYVELQGKGHWFDGVMSTAPLRKFYSKILDDEITWPLLPHRFAIVIPMSMLAPRGGLLVDQLLSPDQPGRIEVEQNSSGVWALVTSNVLRFHFHGPSTRVKMPRKLIVDGHCCAVEEGTAPEGQWIVRSSDGNWIVTRAFSAHKNVYDADADRFPEMQAGAVLHNGTADSWVVSMPGFNPMEDSKSTVPNVKPLSWLCKTRGIFSNTLGQMLRSWIRLSPREGIGGI